MSTSFASDENNEFLIENGEFVLVADGAQVVQNVRERLLSYLEDWFLDRRQGVPYFQIILTKPFDLIQAESIMKETILQTDGIERLIAFASTFDPDLRKWQIVTTFQTTFGSVEGVTING